MATYTVGRRRVIIILLLTSILLLTLDLRGNRVIDRARDGAAVVLSPLENAAQVVTRPAVNVWRSITEFDDLQDEVLRLQAQIDAQRGTEIAGRNAMIENQRLLALNDLESLADIPTVTASIIGLAPNNFDQVIEIDRGSAHGIEVGMAVVNEAGLVGKITRVNRNSSLVMLVTDPQYAVRVKVLSEAQPTTTTSTPDTVPSGLDAADVTTTTSTTTTTTTTTVPDVFDPDTTDPGVDDPDADADADSDPDADADDPDADDPDADADSDPDDDPDADPDGPDNATTTTVEPIRVNRETGTLTGQGGNRLPLVTFIVSSSVRGTISVGDTVSTAGGIGSLAPPDIPVGTVARVISPPGSSGDELQVQLSANLSRLQFVRVVIYKPLEEMTE